MKWLCKEEKKKKRKRKEKREKKEEQGDGGWGELTDLGRNLRLTLWKDLGFEVKMLGLVD